MILVTGATGNVGGYVTRMLRERGTAMRAFVRDAERARALFGDEVPVSVGDFEDAASLRAAMNGIDAVFLACSNQPRQAELEMAAIDAARDTGVRRIVKLSAIGADVASPLSFWEQHGRIEEQLRRSGVPHVVLRPSALMQYLLASAPSIAQYGALFAPLAGAANAFIDARDVAEVAVTALLSGEHTGRTYVLTGPELLTFDRIAADIGAVIGRPVAFVPVPEEEAHREMLGSGMPPWLAEQITIMMRLQRGGAAAEQTETVRELTGRVPRSWRDFVREHAALFQVTSHQ
jgi:uncharacterized protein YbjT (DUF2867 family)